MNFLYSTLKVKACQLLKNNNTPMIFIGMLKYVVFCDFAIYIHAIVVFILFMFNIHVCMYI